MLDAIILGNAVGRCKMGIKSQVFVIVWFLFKRFLVSLMHFAVKQLAVKVLALREYFS
jgi:hypothetical protein